MVVRKVNFSIPIIRSCLYEVLYTAKFYYLSIASFLLHFKNFFRFFDQHFYIFQITKLAQTDNWQALCKCSTWTSCYFFNKVNFG